MAGKKILFSVILTLILCFSVGAITVTTPGDEIYESSDYDITVEAIEDKVTIDGLAEFNIIILNKRKTIEKFDIDFIFSDNWKNVYTDPLYHGTSDFGIKAYPEKSNIVKVKMRPREDLIQGKTHSMEAKLTHKESGKVVTIPFNVYIKPISEQERKYVPNVGVRVIVPPEVDPREEVEIKVLIDNKNPRTYGENEITVEVESKLLGQKTYTIGLRPLGSNLVEIPLILDPLQEPIKDTIKTMVTIEGYSFKPSDVHFSVLDYTTSFLDKKEEKKGFLKKTTVFSYTNTGNLKKKQTIEIPTTTLQDLFTSTKPKSKTIENADGKKFLAWDIELKPKETAEIVITTSYRTLFFIVCLFVILIWVYYYMKSPIIMTKNAPTVDMQEGGISEIKIMLNVKNTGNKAVNKIEIMDIIPHIADVKKEIQIGTLSPSRILKTKKGKTKIIWDMDSLDPGEDRIITYKIKSRLSILGEFILPAGEVHYKDQKGKKVIVKSNRLRVGP